MTANYDFTNNTLLHLVCQNGHVELCSSLLKDKSINPYTVNRYNKTPLMLAYENNHYNIILLLLQRREIDMKTIDNNNTHTIISDYHWDMQGLLYNYWKYKLYPDRDNFNY